VADSSSYTHLQPLKNIQTHLEIFRHNLKYPDTTGNILDIHFMLISNRLIVYCPESSETPGYYKG
jgi:hypothetical protein